MTDFAELVLLCFIGRIFIYLWMEFPLPQWMENNKFFGGIHRCPLCSGVYIYSIIFLIFDVDVLQMMGIKHLEVMGGLMTGGAISFLVHLIVQGYRAIFEVTVIE